VTTGVPTDIASSELFMPIEVERIEHDVGDRDQGDVIGRFWRGEKDDAIDDVGHDRVPAPAQQLGPVSDASLEDDQLAARVAPQNASDELVHVRMELEEVLRADVDVIVVASIRNRSALVRLRQVGPIVVGEAAETVQQE
jgi:hypothetical protein